MLITEVPEAFKYLLGIIFLGLLLAATTSAYHKERWIRSANFVRVDEASPRGYVGHSIDTNETFQTAQN